ncbi:hypothetical protein PV10_03339 [Exophiala mesophila]|uniref:MJ1316 RNA cyclic group end recognition domain-containing protein n=1 Tax=Exophiala mesophila TaxID=212818 RepID=A0A0D1X1R8_EXOME|nr:uncharacterized protein PV10_03339 [Exophiala mesophila]KIV95720.1 hypothetical protein PV10_03339 [Exophiala mesophila]
MANPSSTNRFHRPIHDLRILAEQHLREIEDELAQEEKDDAKRLQDLERYTKRRRGQDETPPFSDRPPTAKMRPAQVILNRLKWDRELDITKFRVGYLERFAGIREIPAQDWINEVTDEDWIPQHRIKYFKRLFDDGSSQVVWDRDLKIDKMSGPTADTFHKDHDRPGDVGTSTILQDCFPIGSEK